jgi:LmbE family N-acetylglucosaminyl deacetylase
LHSFPLEPSGFSSARETRRLLGVFAHPDDEAFGPGATLARYAKEGAEVYLLTATHGEQGKVHGGIPPFTEKTLGEIRDEELRCAAVALGLKDWRILGYPDGRLSEVSAEELTEHVVRSIRRWRPQVLLTFAPDGLTGHPDHIAISQATSRAFDLSGSPDAFPEQGRQGLNPYSPKKLYYYVFPATLVTRAGLDVIGTPDENVTTCVDVRSFRCFRGQAIRCHQSQLTPRPSKGSISQKTIEESRLLLRTTNHFVLARGFEKGKTERETDLFGGVSV